MYQIPAEGGSPPLPGCISYNYDDNGRLSQFRTVTGQEVLYQCDPLNRLTQQTYSPGLHKKAGYRFGIPLSFFIQNALAADITGNCLNYTAACECALVNFAHGLCSVDCSFAVFRGHVPGGFQTILGALLGSGSNISQRAAAFWSSASFAASAAAPIASSTVRSPLAHLPRFWIPAA